MTLWWRIFVGKSYRYSVHQFWGYQIRQHCLPDYSCHDGQWLLLVVLELGHLVWNRLVGYSLLRDLSQRVKHHHKGSYHHKESGPIFSYTHFHPVHRQKGNECTCRLEHTHILQEEGPHYFPLNYLRRCQVHLIPKDWGTRSTSISF